MFLTQARLKPLDFKEVENLKIIRALNINNAHGYDDISISMIKICGKSLLKPLIHLFKNSSQSSCYPDIWKRCNIIPAHKKSDKQLVNNDRPISLLPICGKIFEKMIFNKIYNFLFQESLLNSNLERLTRFGMKACFVRLSLSGKLYNLLESYLSGRPQRVVLNGQTSSWRPVLADVPQG